MWLVLESFRMQCNRSRSLAYYTNDERASWHLMLRTRCECNLVQNRGRKKNRRQRCHSRKAHAERRFSRGITSDGIPGRRDVSKNILDTSPTNFPRMRPMYRASGIPRGVRRDSRSATWESRVFAPAIGEKPRETWG